MFGLHCHKALSWPHRWVCHWACATAVMTHGGCRDHCLETSARFWTLSSGWKMMMYTFGMYSIPSATDALRFMEIVSVVACM